MILAVLRDGKGKGANLLLTAQRYDIVDCPTNCISGAKHVGEGSNKCQQLATKDLTRLRGAYADEFDAKTDTLRPGISVA